MTITAITIDAVCYDVCYCSRAYELYSLLGWEMESIWHKRTGHTLCAVATCYAYHTQVLLLTEI